MSNFSFVKTMPLIVAVLASIQGFTFAQTTRIEIELNGTAPTAFSPLAAVFHDGSFDSFTVGDNLSGTGLETLAEVGAPGDFLADALADAPTADVGTNGAPTAPSSSSSFFVDVDGSNTQFSFASMVLFSNDWFVGTQTANAIDISSLLGGSLGDELVIDLNQVYDAGTEVEDYTGVGGSAFFPFSTSGALGQDITNGSSSIVDRSSNPYLNFTNVDNLDLQGFDPASLDSFTAPSLGNITLRVVAVPEPSAAIVCVLFGGVALFRRRK